MTDEKCPRNAILEQKSPVENSAQKRSKIKIHLLEHTKLQKNREERKSPDSSKKNLKRPRSISPSDQKIPEKQLKQKDSLTLPSQKRVELPQDISAVN